MTTEEIALAMMIRLRCGTRVKVVSPVRWLHSLVTARIAISGRMMTTGKRIAVAKVEYVRPLVRSPEDDSTGGEQ